MARNDPAKPRKTAAKDAGPVRAQIDAQRKVSRSPSFVSFYANDIQIQTSLWDMRLILSELGDTGEGDTGPTIAVQQIAELRISLQLAKVLTALMSQQLRTYEENVGPIPIPMK